MMKRLYLCRTCIGADKPYEPEDPEDLSVMRVTSTFYDEKIELKKYRNSCPSSPSCLEEYEKKYGKI